MKLRGIDFGHVMNASGGRNFFGQGYPYHRFWQHLGLDYTGSTFVAKTTTLEPRAGNMPLTDYTLQPIERIPRCIKVNICKAAVLNAVSLSGPGADNLFKRKIWQARNESLFISFAAVADTPQKRIDQWKKFADLAWGYIRPHQLTFATRIGLEMNLFCPNTGVAEKPIVQEILTTLDIASNLQIPLVAKINALMPVELAVKIQEHPACDAICVSNTIPFGQMPSQIDWQNLWGSDAVSPLHRFGGGGLSGAPIFWLVVEWIQNVRKKGFYKPIVGCGGIMSWQNACVMLNAGANAVQLGSVSIVRPWRVKNIIASANAYAKEKYGA
ncbi:MAG: hypothetical protein Q8R30_01295 [bacterium]|nr:hypothetical protein [bacterium]MDZ4285667.1 hypothetical protein [Candidatus Sungbacteria bacterium]